MTQWIPQIGALPTRLPQGFIENSHRFALCVPTFFVFGCLWCLCMSQLP